MKRRIYDRTTNSLTASTYVVYSLIRQSPLGSKVGTVPVARKSLVIRSRTYKSHFNYAICLGRRGNAQERGRKIRRVVGSEGHRGRNLSP